jgi:ABC-2 type transport system permease protein
MTQLDVSAPQGRLVTGPSALSDDWRRFLLLTRTIAVMEFKLRFFGSMLGYLWQLVRPLLLFAVLYVVFTQFVKVTNAEFFPVALLLGIVLFTFFAEATSGAVTCVVDRENLVRKIHFPRLVIPLSVVLTAAFNLVLNLTVVLIFAIASGVPFRLSWLEVPLLVVVLGALAVGIATLLSALYVRFRDVRPIWEVALQVTFYASLIIVPFEAVHDSHPELAKLLLFNPLAAVLQQARHAFVDPNVPSAAGALGSAGLLVVPAAIVLGVFALGLWVFSREAPRIAEDL